MKIAAFGATFVTGLAAVFGATFAALVFVVAANDPVGATTIVAIATAAKKPSFRLNAELGHRSCRFVSFAIINI